jgi:cullin-associated NEDD8-dissociated protein 1
MISEQDLQRATLALRVATNLVNTAPVAKNHVNVIKMAVTATTSELIQGSCLDQLQEFFRAAAKQKIVDKVAVSTLQDLVSLKSQQSALCLAIVVVGDSQHSGCKTSFSALANDSAPKKQITGLLCLGEYGKLVDLSKEAEIFNLIQKYFSNANEEVRQAASISLGKITIGNPKFFLDKVFNLVTKSEAKQKYLFLNTIREIILNDSDCLKDYIKPMRDLLI